jgi:hypothetical protein
LVTVLQVVIIIEPLPAGSMRKTRKTEMV